MNKKEFLETLCQRLSVLSQKDIDDRLNFYCEMIDDKVEDGLSEEEAVAQIGNIEDVVTQIAADVPLATIVKQKIKRERRMKPWEIVLLAVGSPIWFSLIAAAFSVVLSLYLSFWAVVISLWASFVSLVACGVAPVAAGIGLCFTGYVPSGLVLVSAGLVCAGLSIFMFFACRATTQGAVSLSKGLLGTIKKSLMKKEKTV